MRTEADRHTNKTWRMKTWSYLQSQRFPPHVLEQSRGGGERALRALLQGQGDACRVTTQRVHQVLQLPAHLADNNRVMRVSDSTRVQVLHIVRIRAAERAASGLHVDEETSRLLNSCMLCTLSLTQI